MRSSVSVRCSSSDDADGRVGSRDAKCGLLSWDPSAPKYFVLAAFCANLNVASTRCATQARLCAPIVLYYSAPPASRAGPRLGPFPCSLTQFMPTLAPPQRGASHRIASHRITSQRIPISAHSQRHCVSSPHLAPLPATAASLPVVAGSRSQTSNSPANPPPLRCVADTCLPVAPRSTGRASARKPPLTGWLAWHPSSRPSVAQRGPAQPIIPIPSTASRS